ncbi:Phage integrase family protein [compost metagenome]
MLALRWADIDLNKATAFIPHTKNGHARAVPLSRRAVQVLQALPRSIDNRVIPVQAAALHKLFGRACKRAAITDLRWHDLRHTAVSRLAERLPNVVELAAVSGHRSLTMLQRYYHVGAEELARKIG